MASPNMEMRYSFLPLQRKREAGAPPRKQESGLVERRVSCRAPQRQESGDIWGCQLRTGERLWRGSSVLQNPARRPWGSAANPPQQRKKAPAPQISPLLMATLGSADQRPVVPPSGIKGTPVSHGVLHRVGRMGLGHSASDGARAWGKHFATGSDRWQGVPFPLVSSFSAEGSPISQPAGV